MGAVTLKGDMTTTGFNAAYAHYQNAAYALEAAAKYAQEHGVAEALGDLGEGVAAGLGQVMLGCGQYCVFNKALKGGARAPVLVKVEGQIPLFMDAGVRAVEECAAVTSSAAAKDWVRHVRVVAAVNRADTCLRLNEVLGDAGRHELRLGRLQQAAATLDEAKRGVSKMASGPAQQELRGTVERLSATAAAEVQKGLRENSLIYHLAIPSVASLPALEGAPMAKAAAAQDFLPVVEPPAPHFADLTPFCVRNGARAYAEQRDARVAAIAAIANDANSALGSALARMGLPGKLEALAASSSSSANSQQQQLPPALLEKAAHVRQEGGARHVEERLRLVNDMAEETARAIKEAAAAIDAEEQEDNDLRRTYGQRWTRCPSYSLNTGFREEVAKLTAHSDSARKSNAFVAERWQAAAEAVATLELAPEEIAARIPKAAESPEAKTLAAAPETAALRADLNALKQIAADRAAARDALQQAAAADDIAPALLAAGSNEADYPAIFEAQLQHYDAFEEAARASSAAQEDALRRTADDNDAFDTLRADTFGSAAAAAASDPRADFLQGLDTAYKTFGELRGNLEEGITFYSELQTRIQNLKAKISDFVFARQTEKQDLIASFSGGNNPPQRPPKPATPPYSQQQPQQQQQQQVPGGWNPYQYQQYQQPQYSSYTQQAPPPPPPQQQQQQYGYNPYQQQQYGYPPQQGPYYR